MCDILDLDLKDIDNYLKKVEESDQVLPIAKTMIPKPGLTNLLLTYVIVGFRTFISEKYNAISARKWLFGVETFWCSMSRQSRL